MIFLIINILITIPLILLKYQKFCNTIKYYITLLKNYFKKDIIIYQYLNINMST